MELKCEKCGNDSVFWNYRNDSRVFCERCDAFVGYDDEYPYEDEEYDDEKGEER